MVKVQRSFPAPASLETESRKLSGSYCEPDVIERLKQDFHNKCYICELKDLQDTEVEHLVPHHNGRYPERKFDWNNLFWSCGHCNKVKNQQKYEGGILDCCRQDPEKAVCFRLKGDGVLVQAKHAEDTKAVLTAELVQEVFNRKNTGMRIYKSDMRLKELKKEMNLLYDSLECIKVNPDSKIAQRKLKALLRRESKFAAFKRNYIRENQDRFPQLLLYIE